MKALGVFAQESRNTGKRGGPFFFVEKLSLPVVSARSVLLVSRKMARNVKTARSIFVY